MAVIALETFLPARPERAFDLSIDVDAHTGSMARSGERTVGGVRSGRLALGDTVTFAARHFGLPWQLAARITAYDRPGRFVDEQVKGPFRRWRHEHTFTWDGERNGTIARDVVEFTAPLGVLGRLVTRAVLERYMRRILIERNAYLARTLGEGP
jgi:ligand-binding SRPBCC domain-containing protein